MSEIKTERKKISDLTTDPTNLNEGTERGLSMLDDSLAVVGLGRSIVTDRNGIILAGNKTTERAIDRGFEDAIVVHTTGDKLVVVQRDDLNLNDPDPNNPAKKLAIYDNRVSELDLHWSAEQLLADLNAGVDLSAMWREDELTELLAGLVDSEPPQDPGAAIDRAEALREQYGVERGQLWTLGRHKILCGDAYSADDLARLLDGKTADMLHIDPPYGIDAVKPDNVTSAVGLPNGAKAQPPGFSRGATAREVSDAAFRSVGATRSMSRTAIIIQPNVYPVIEGDNRPFEPAQFLDHAPIVIMWGANYFAHQLPISSCWVAWDKREDITRNDFADCELAWCNLNKPARVFHHLWNGLHKGSQHGEARTHPTEKPVALFEEIGKMFCEGGLWLDLFAGTGAQLVAAERTGATCYAMEIEPLYVATILDRLERMGLSPERV